MLLPGQQVHIPTATGDWRVGEIEGIVNDWSSLVELASVRLRQNRKGTPCTAVNRQMPKFGDQQVCHRTALILSLTI
ncbi:hypothetical protein EB796_005290 [Bugula neritina]|uniref:Uncharacterized protein n=1 Tax=Bugula neritina TaxID=10212 RepID=A0A7J7KDY9_BUGNE|nr:hypothetical protein EB796_005290 [Bugula neritina]